jgi:hypothetical protein
MSGLKLGDLVLDPRRAVYISSLSAVVCSGLHGALQVGISGGLRGVMERIDGVLDLYRPEFLVVLGPVSSDSTNSFESALTGMARRWGKRAKIQLVARQADGDVRAMAEALGCEVHHELVWGRYRFVESDPCNNLELQLMTVQGAPNYGVKVGGRPFGGMKLPVFLKGFGRLTLPSSNPTQQPLSVFQPELERSDVFAVGHQRVLPLGKVGDLKPFKGIARGLPISKATLGARRRDLKAPSAD